MPRLADKLTTLLTRETSGGRFIPEIDGLRFLAIAAVLLYHINGYTLGKSTTNTNPAVLPGLPEPLLPHEVSANPAAAHNATDFLSRIFAEGYFGVQLFFVISGMILAMPFAEHFLAGAPRVSLKKYFTRRILRLEPPYLINLLFCTALLVVVLHKPIGETLQHLGASALYSHYFIYGEASTINTVTWSLEIEVQFYILAPLLAFVFAIRHAILRRATLVAAIFAIGACQRFFTVPDYQPTFGWTILQQLHWFLIGFVLADLHVTDWRRKPTGGSYLWDIVSTLAGAAIVALLIFRCAIHFTLPVAVFLTYVGAFRGRLFHAIMRWRPIYIIGGMCYTIYLYHFVIITALGKLTTRVAVSDSFAVHLLVQTVLLSLPVLAISALMFALFEKPFMLRDWPAKLKAVLSRRRVHGTA